MYTIEERSSLLQLIISEKCSLSQAQRWFQRQYPSRPTPAKTTISNLVEKYKKTGSVDNQPIPGRPKSVTTKNVQMLVPYLNDNFPFCAQCDNNISLIINSYG